MCESVRRPSSVFYKALLGKRHVGKGEEQTGMSLILPSLCTRNVVLVWVTPVIIVAHRQRNESQCYTKIMKTWGLSTHADLFNSYPSVVLSSRKVNSFAMISVQASLNQQCSKCCEEIRYPPRSRIVDDVFFVHLSEEYRQKHHAHSD